MGMFHDLCKCDNYIHNGDGTYSYNPNVTIPGHAVKSLVLLAANEIGVTEEEKACIRWHMGAFDDKENWDKYGRAVRIRLHGILMTVWCLIRELLMKS